jgi:ribosomal protein L40E
MRLIFEYKKHVQILSKKIDNIHLCYICNTKNTTAASNSTYILRAKKDKFGNE